MNKYVSKNERQMTEEEAAGRRAFNARAAPDRAKGISWTDWERVPQESKELWISIAKAAKGEK